VDFTSEAKTLCEALVESGERFGLGVPIDIITGAKTQSIMQKNFGGRIATELKSYNASQKSKKWWVAFSQMMEVAGIIAPYYSSTFRLFRVTDLGHQVRMGLKNLDPLVPTQALRKLDQNLNVVSGGWQSKSGSSSDSNVSQTVPLRKALTLLRKEIARERNLPPYLIMSESVIEALVKFQPCSAAELSVVPGLTQHQVDRYGARLAETIAGWKKSASMSLENLKQAIPAVTRTPPQQSAPVNAKRKLAVLTPVIPAKSIKTSEGSSPSNGEREIVQQSPVTPTVKKSSDPVNPYMKELWAEFEESGKVGDICEKRLLRMAKVEDILSKCILAGYQLPLDKMNLSPDSVTKFEAQLSAGSSPSVEFFKKMSLAQLASAAKITNLKHQHDNSVLSSWELNLLKAHFQFQAAAPQ
jgi:hypothetical protein